MLKIKERNLYLPFCVREVIAETLAWPSAVALPETCDVAWPKPVPVIAPAAPPAPSGCEITLPLTTSCTWEGAPGRYEITVPFAAYMLKTCMNHCINDGHDSSQDPSTREGFFFKGRFFSGLAYRPHVSGENDHWKRAFPKTLENAGLSFSYGWTKTKVFEYDDIIHHIRLALCTIRKGYAIVFPSSVFV